MTFPAAGTINAVQAAIGGLTLAGANAYVSNGMPAITAFPVALQHGLNESYWADPGLIQEMNIILNQANYVYRI